MIDTLQSGRPGRLKMGAFGLSVLALVVCAACKRDKLDVLYVATPDRVVEEMLKLADLREGDVVYDLGCGDGRIVISAVLTEGVTGVGVDIDPRRIRESRRNAEQKGVEDRVRFLEQDLFATDIREASVVMLYLDPDVLNELKPKILAELKPGTRVVCHRYSFSDWQPDAASTVVIGNNLHNIFLFAVPAERHDFPKS